MIDLDGTLADSLAALKKSYFEFLAAFEKTGSLQEFEEMNGPPLSKIINLLARRHDLAGTIEDHVSHYTNIINENMRMVEPVTGAGSILSEAADKGWTIIIVTSRTHSSAEEWLNSQTLMAQITAIVGGDDVLRGKPWPDPYLLAVERIGCAPSSCLAVEDSIQGATAALAGDIPTLIIQPDVPVELARHPRLIGHLPDLLALRDYL